MYVYMIGAFNGGGKLVSFKVGVTSDIRRRIKELQTGNMMSLRLVYAWLCGSQEEAFSEESRLLHDCRGLRCKGEWFREHSFLKVLLHLVRQMKEPALFGSKSKPFGNEYSGSRVVEKCLAEARELGPKRPLVPMMESDAPKDYFKTYCMNRRAESRKTRDKAKSMSGPCITIYE